MTNTEPEEYTQDDYIQDCIDESERAWSRCGRDEDTEEDEDSGEESCEDEEEDDDGSYCRTTRMC
jgi:hypothetical protein